MTDATERRLVWQERWERRDADDFGWHLDEPPPQLVQLLEREGLPGGAAVDIACGNGVVARYLASSFSPSIGFDIAVGAVAQARAAGTPGQHPAFFLAADATAAWPFRDGAFVFAFDRGGLQNIPRETWPGYFQEASRVIVAGGLLQILTSRGMKRGSPSPSRRVVRKLRSLTRSTRAPAETGLEARMKQLADPDFEVLTAERFSFETRRGNTQQFTHTVFRRRGA